MSARPHPIDVLVAGEYFCDLIFAGLEGLPRLGSERFARDLVVRPGGCYNMALALTRLGIATAWAADFGTDLFSRAVLEAAARDGLDPVAFNRVEESVQRVSAAFAKDGERGFISYSETPIRPPHRDLLARLKPKWLLQSFRFEPDWLGFIKAAKSAGTVIFADCRDGDFTLATPGVREFLALADVFSPNEAEALALTGAADVEAALDVLAELTPAVLIKRGVAGAIGIDRGRRVEVPAPMVEVVDTVGAGDAFNAGYLAGAIWESSFAECARLAVACGTLSTTGPGSSRTPDAATLSAFNAGLGTTRRRRARRPFTTINERDKTGELS